jgi:glycosyltransferase involved in cell wall biosynthesis
MIKPYVSIVIPVYRSERILDDLVDQIQAAMNLAGLENNYEVILVNDASPDNSWEVIRSQAARHQFIRGISLRRNFGQHNATMAGLHKARGSVIVVMDDDLQHSPSALGVLIEQISDECDVCYTRYLNRQHAKWKIIGSWLNNQVATMLLNKPRTLYLSSFKALKSDIAKEIIKYDGPYVYLDGLILDTTRQIKSINIEHRPRHEGEGNYNFRRSFSLWLQMATSFSVLPLRIASFAGFLMSALSFVLIVAVFIIKLLDPGVPVGWPSLISVILFIGGIQTICLGVIGEYLGRTYLKINKKPQFVVGSDTNQERIPNGRT